MSLSAEGRDLLRDFRETLRQEYREGCRNTQSIPELCQNSGREAKGLASAEEGQTLRSVFRALEGSTYAGAKIERRRQLLTEVGLQVGRLLGDAPKAKVTAGPSIMSSTLDKRYNSETDVQYLKGVGPKLAQLLGRLGITKLGDLLNHFPHRWEDRTRVATARTVVEGESMVVEGTLGRVMVKEPRRGLSIVTCPLYTIDGAVDLTWFNQKWILNGLKTGAEVFAFGKIEIKYQKPQITAAELELASDPNRLAGRWVPVYPLTARLTQKWCRSLMLTVVPALAPKLAEPLPESVIEQRGFMPRSQAVYEYHFPPSPVSMAEARRRLAYEELFFLQVEIGQQRRTRDLEPRLTSYDPTLMTPQDFYELLPFRPTGAQARVCSEVVSDLLSAAPMNRLLQGDVGSGKTAVAAFAVWAAIQQGYQAAIMAPTEILAEQHHQKLRDLLEPGGIRIGFLSGSVKKKAKLEVKRQIADHELDLVVGTHALLQPDVEFPKLSLVVVDEQHKFGVMQRTVLRQKGYKHNPDLLVMTATPIPRTLALTVHGELEVSRLDELPPGRQPIVSESVKFSKRKSIYKDIRESIKEGRQAYIVCPLVEESENLEATSATEEHRVIAEDVFPEFSVGLLHGRMKAAEKEAVMEAFRQGEHQILVSTTVIEVGVDVPNATTMLVQDANRFGLSQLHQLRGRVGRGSHSSRCIFMADAKSADSQRRLKAIAELSDGFDVAEEDLQIRGPGDYYGLRQSGFPEFKVADLTRDLLLLQEARKDALALIERDPDLRGQPELRKFLRLRAERTAELVH